MNLILNITINVLKEQLTEHTEVWNLNGFHRGYFCYVFLIIAVEGKTDLLGCNRTRNAQNYRKTYYK